MNTDNEKSSGEMTSRFPTFRKLVSPRFLKFAGIAFLALVTLIGLYYAIANWRGAREWKNVRAMLEEKGEPLSFADLVPPLPPDEENFAMTPYFEGALDKTIDPETGAERWRGWQQRVTTNRLPDLGPLGLDVEGVWRLGERAHVVWKQLELESAARDLGMQINTNEPFGVLSQFVSLAEADMLRIEEDLQRPYSQFPVHYEDNVGALLPHLAEIRRFARVFSFRALAHLRQGEPDAALKDISTTLQLAESVKVEPILISQLVRQAILQFALQVVWEGLADRVWTAEQVAALQAQLKDIDVLGGYQDGMRGERIFGMDLTDIVERERNLAMYGDMIASGSPWGNQIQVKLVDWAPRGWYLRNKAFIARMHTEVSIESVDPESHRVYLDRVREYDARLIGALESDSTLFIARIVMPAVSKAAVRTAESQAYIDLAIAACALERHRLANGGFPETLAALVPEFASSSPIDVIDGKPLRYRKTGSGFIVYSIGADEIDGDGVPAFTEKHNERVWLRDEGDWAWGYSAEYLGLD